MLSTSSTSSRRRWSLAGACILLLVALPLHVRAEHIAPTDKRIQLSGRWDTQGTNPKTSWSAATVRFRFRGTGCSAVITTSGSDYLSVCIDGKFVKKIALGKSSDPIVIAEDLKPGVHKVDLVKATESFVGTIRFGGLELPRGVKLLKSKRPTRRIEFIGDSITAGYGNEDDDRNHHFRNDTENAALTYGVLTARKLGADWTCVAISGIWLSTPPKGDAMPTVYPRLSPWTSGSRWDFRRNVPNAVVINLGTNDARQKPFDSKKYAKAWTPFVAAIRKKYPKAHIFCTIGPMGQSKQMKDIIKKAVAKINAAGDARVYAVKLPVQNEKIDGIGADWHPTVKCHQRVADALAPIIAKRLGWKSKTGHRPRRP